MFISGGRRHDCFRHSQLAVLRWTGHVVLPNPAAIMTASGILAHVVYSNTKFPPIRDTVVQYDPVHAALIWAGIRLLLHVCFLPVVQLPLPTMQIGNSGLLACSYMDCMEAVLVSVEMIGKVLLLCAVSEERFLRSGVELGDCLAEILANLYVPVYEF